MRLVVMLDRLRRVIVRLVIMRNHAHVRLVHVLRRKDVLVDICYDRDFVMVVTVMSVVAVVAVMAVVTRVSAVVVASVVSVIS